MVPKMRFAHFWHHISLFRAAKPRESGVCKGGRTENQTHSTRERLFLPGKVAAGNLRKEEQNGRAACAARPFCSSFLLGWGGFASREKMSLPVRAVPQTPATLDH